LAGMSAESKPLAILDSNVIVYSIVTDYPDKTCHKRCFGLLERWLRGELQHILSLDPLLRRKQKEIGRYERNTCGLVSNIVFF